MIAARPLPFPTEGQSFVVEFEPATEKREANNFTVILKQVATRRLADLASFFSGVSLLARCVVCVVRVCVWCFVCDRVVWVWKREGGRGKDKK